MDPEGRSLAVSHRDYDVTTAKIGYAEQDPEVWWSRTVETIREALGKSGIRPEELTGIGLSGQMHGVVALDRDRLPVLPAIIWMDQRSAEETREIKKLAAELAGATVWSFWWD